MRSGHSPERRFRFQPMSAGFDHGVDVLTTDSMVLTTVSTVLNTVSMVLIAVAMVPIAVAMVLDCAAIVVEVPSPPSATPSRAGISDNVSL